MTLAKLIEFVYQAPNKNYITNAFTIEFSMKTWRLQIKKKILSTQKAIQNNNHDFLMCLC